MGERAVSVGEWGMRERRRGETERGKWGRWRERHVIFFRSGGIEIGLVVEVVFVG